HEMVDLPEHGAGPSHLPHQPLEHAVARLTRFRHELSGLVREINHERGRFHQADAGVAVDDGGDAGVRADLQELRLELPVLADVDGMYGIRQLHRLRPEGRLAAAWGGPGS